MAGPPGYNRGMISFRPLRLAVLLGIGASAAFAAGAPPNTLAATEKKAGWKLLFDGQSQAGWHGVKKGSPIPPGWSVKDGVLSCAAGNQGGDIVSDQVFDNFELSWEWAMPSKSNNGVKYFITEERGTVGHEYQMIDDSIVAKDHQDGSTAAFYLVVAPDPVKKKVKPFGEWNHSRVIVNGNHVEHWLNGQKVVEYECGSPAVLEQVKKTKFKTTPGFGTKVRGHILLTYHHDEASFRNVKLRELPAK